jgi:hypothetical protein
MMSPYEQPVDDGSGRGETDRVHALGFTNAQQVWAVWCWCCCILGYLWHISSYEQHVDDSRQAMCARMVLLFINARRVSAVCWWSACSCVNVTVCVRMVVPIPDMRDGAWVCLCLWTYECAFMCVAVCVGIYTHTRSHTL